VRHTEPYAEKHPWTFERIIAFIAGIIAAGWLAGFFAWAMATFFAPQVLTKAGRKDFTDWGSGLAGIAVATWFLSEWLFY
jgi:hypothetical protein